MADVKLNHIYKVYPNGLKAVNDFSMEIEDKEFIVFVGPSGCGKSTTLRMIAGLEDITAGELVIGGTVMNYVEPKDRDIAMVFQNYALYPHMTVYENMAFGLRLRRMSKEEIDTRVKEAAEILGITDYLKKKPKEMSGGQRQRVALGRAIVREPKVFLLDEPLSNLDAKLRTAMRAEISKLHKKLKTTFIYVTHDQVEAMTMGTRIVVMKDGYVQQIDTPGNLYNHPCNKFVAGFIGTPQMNFFNAKLKREDKIIKVSFENTDAEFNVPQRYLAKVDENYLDGEKQVIAGIRSEHISVDTEMFSFKAKCRVSYVEDLGVESQIYADFAINSEDAVLESPTKVIIKSPAGITYETDEVIEVSLDLKYLHLFDAETENTIAPRIPENYSVKGEVKSNVLSILGAKLPLPPTMSTEDGEYEVRIPVTAISFGGDIKAEFSGEDKVNEKRIAEVVADGKILFIPIADEEKIEVKTNTKSKTSNDKSITFCSISIDLKYLTLLRNGEAVCAAMPVQNSISGKVIKTKVVVQKEVKGKLKTVKEPRYRFTVGEESVEIPEEISSKMLKSGGKNIFRDIIELRLAVNCCYVAEEGFTATVVKIADYGNEKFAECSLNEDTVFVPVAEDFDGNEIKLGINWDGMSVYDKDFDIRLV
ncbi:MAG: sn-glycerol-3-phosphate ABC transporter ATP-binding protein UgpC [Clostridia bacterium]|nr:sn-glycerol-3-phosphate ABC transporter ATP-binding protein UgpC [Clostridia bacterium]